MPRPIEVGAEEAASAAFLFPRHRRRRIVGIALEKEETTPRGVWREGKRKREGRQRSFAILVSSILSLGTCSILGVVQKQPPEWKPSDKHCLSEDDLFGCPELYFRRPFVRRFLPPPRSLSLGSFYEDGLRPPRARTAEPLFPFFLFRLVLPLSYLSLLLLLFSSRFPPSRRCRR